MTKEQFEALGYALTALYGKCDDCETFCVERDSEQCLRCPFGKSLDIILDMRKKEWEMKKDEWKEPSGCF